MSARVCERDGCEVEVTGRSVRCPEHQAEHRRAAKRESDRRARAASVRLSARTLADEAEAERQAEIEAVCNALKGRKRAFVLEYVANGGNATEAAKTAGYSETTARQQGSRLLTNVDILAAVRALQALTDGARGEVAAYDALRVLHETIIGLREPDRPGEVLDAAKALLDRRDRRELLELRERLKRESPADVVSESRLVLVVPEPARDEEEWAAMVEREVGGSARRPPSH